MIKKIEHLYVNQSFQRYEANFVNLARIKRDRISFDYRTRFLSEPTKQMLNSTNLDKYNNSVVISKIDGVWFFVCDLKNEAYASGRVKVHELTLPDTIQGMSSNLHYYNVEATPVILIYEKKIDFKHIVSLDKHIAKYENESMESWIFNGKFADQLIKLINENEQFYIADGHHRLFTSSISQSKYSVMTSFIHRDSIKLSSIPRIIPDVTNQEFNKALNFLKSRDMITSVNKLQKGVIKLSRQGVSYFVRLIDLDGDLFWNNDVYRFNTQVLSQAFGIYDSSKVTYVDEKIININDLDSKSVLVHINPLSVDEFMTISKSNAILPPKSTMFSPKYPSFSIFKKYKELV